MMGGISEKTNQDMENLLRGGAFSNLSHRDALRKRLFDETAVLSVEDLDGVTGGVTAEVSALEDWPDDSRRF